MMITRWWVAVVGSLVSWTAQAAPSAQQDYVDAANARPDAIRGAQLYGGCASCHGPDGQGVADGSAPRIAGQLRSVIIRQLVDYRYARRPDPRMEHMADRHLLKDSQAIADVSAFIASLEPLAPAGVGLGNALELGRQIYLGRCSSCHGRSAEGDALAIAPRLAGQHYAYLLRQFRDALDGRRPQLAMTHGRLLKDLDRDALQGLADSLSRADRTSR